MLSDPCIQMTWPSKQLNAWPKLCSNMFEKKMKTAIIQKKKDIFLEKFSILKTSTSRCRNSHIVSFRSILPRSSTLSYFTYTSNTCRGCDYFCILLTRGLFTKLAYLVCVICRKVTCDHFRCFFLDSYQFLIRLLCWYDLEPF